MVTERSSPPVSKNGARNSVKAFFSAVTIEPMLFFRNCALFVMYVVKENLKLDRFCRVKLGYSEEECANMNDGEHEDLQVEVQKLDNLFIFYESLVAMIIPIILIAFIASWSDKRGRRLPMCLSLLGNALYAGLYFLEALFPSWPPWVLLFASFLQSLGGGWMLFYMAAYSYIADKSSKQTRVLRFTIMNVIWQLGSPVGTVLGAVIYDVGGYIWVFGFSLVIYIVCLIYTAIVVKDKPVEETSDPSVKERSPWHPRNVTDLFQTCFRKRPNRGRIHIIIVMSMMLGLYSATAHKLYLWTLRVLNWDQNKYSLYSTISQLVGELVTLVSAPILRHFEVHDCVIGAGAVLLRLINMLALGFVTSSDQWWVMYLFVFVPGTLPSISIRSILSKLGQENEVGRLFSMLGLLEVFWPIVDSAIFTAVYGATVESYPSFEHFVSAYFNFYTFCGFLGIHLSLASVELKVMLSETRQTSDQAEKDQKDKKYE